MIAVPVTEPLNWIAVASPAYLARAGRPTGDEEHHGSLLDEPEAAPAEFRTMGRVEPARALVYRTM